MSWLSEDPTLVIIVGIGILGILIGRFIQTGQRNLLLAAGGVALLTMALVAIEHFWVTDHERIVMRLEITAAALEANDTQAVLSNVSPNAQSFRSVLELLLPAIQVEQVKITNVKTTINELMIPPTATVDFLAVVKGSYRGQSSMYEKTPFQLRVELEKINDDWYLSNYLEGPLAGGSQGGRNTGFGF